MSVSRDPLSDKYLQHVHDVREGAARTVAEGEGRMQLSTIIRAFWCGCGLLPRRREER